ncbi:hypothetical protein AB1Y20_009781 [Prymnesium parvum]|uniref:Transcription initiation factor IIF subunit alpha n=1 Tax=Prymnesium parvum TaxID=97485 RepID=A0AB34K5C4_PRYPA
MASWETLAIPSEVVCDYSETKGEGTELWLVRCPPSFDVATLDGIDLEESQLERGAAVGSDGLVLRAAPSVECGNYMLALPSAKANRWRLGKQPSRQLALTRTYDASWTTDGMPTALPPPKKHFGLYNRHPSSFGALPADAAPLECHAPEREEHAGKPSRKEEKKKHKRKAELRKEEESVQMPGTTALEESEEEARKRRKREKKALKLKGDAVAAGVSVMPGGPVDAAVTTSLHNEADRKRDKAEKKARKAAKAAKKEAKAKSKS